MTDKKEPTLKQVQLINIEYNAWNGFIFSILNVEGGHFSGELFGVHFAGYKSHFIINILFFQFEIKSPIN